MVEARSTGGRRYGSWSWNLFFFLDEGGSVPAFSFPFLDGDGVLGPGKEPSISSR